MSVVIFVRDAGSGAGLEPLARELALRGAGLEVLAGASFGLDGSALPGVAAMLARHGVVVIAGCPAPPGALQGCRSVEICLADVADPAKLQPLLRDLELKGLVPPPAADVSSEEEALIRERLERLGYL